MKFLAAKLPVVALAAVVPTLSSCEVPLQEQYKLASTSSLPEGVAYDPASHAFFATAINGGKITRVSLFGQETEFFATDDPNASFGGAHVDEDRGWLWVCVVDIKTNPFPTSKAIAVDIAAKNIVHSVDLPVPSFCNDLTTDDAGLLYVTDSAQPNIYRIDPAGEGFTVFATDPIWTPVAPGVLALNGLDFAPDGDSLMVVTTVPAAMYRVSLSDPTDITAVQFSGDPFAMPGDPRFPGPDGLEFLGDKLYVAYDGGIQQVVFEAGDYTSGSVLTTTAVPTGLTSLTVVEDEQLYAIDSEVFRVLYTNQPPELPFAILRVDTAAFVAQ